MVSRHSKTTYYLLIILLLIAGGLLFNRYFDKAQREEVEEKQTIFGGITKDSVDRIEISFTDKQHVLKKQDSHWRVDNENFPADKDLITAIFDTLDKARIMTIASEKPDKASQFEVDEENGTKISLWQGETEKTSFTAGRNGPDFNSTYVKMKEKDPIFLVSSDISGAFRIDDFRETQLTDVSSTDVDKMTIIYPDQQFTIIKKEEKWQVEGDDAKNLNQDETQNFLNSLLALRATDIPSQETDNRGFESPVFQAQFFGPGVEENIIFGKKEGENFFAKNQQNFVFLLAKDQAESVMKKLPDLEEKIE